MERFLRLDDRFPENLYSRVAYKDKFVFVKIRRPMFHALIDAEIRRKQADLRQRAICDAFFCRHIERKMNLWR